MEPTGFQEALSTNCASSILVSSGAGGGKTVGLLYDAVTSVSPGGRAVVLSVDPRGLGATTDRLYVWPTTQVGEHGIDNVWRFRHGAEVHLDDRRAVDEGRLGEFDYVGIDDIHLWADDDIDLVVSQVEAARAGGAEIRVVFTIHPAGRRDARDIKSRLLDGGFTLFAADEVKRLNIAPHVHGRLTHVHAWGDMPHSHMARAVCHRPECRWYPTHDIHPGAA